MRAAPAYNLYRPKWYRKRVSTWWWAQQWRSFKFILRELSSLAVGYVGLLLLLTVWMLGRGAGDYAELQAWLSWPPVVLITVIAMLFVLYHSITWFNLTPKAMPPIRVGGKRVADWLISAPNYVIWVVLSVIIYWFVKGGS